MNTFQRAYYSFICCFLPNLFLLFVMTASNDILLASVSMIALIYFMMNLYYFKEEGNNMNEIIKEQVKALVDFDQKQKFFFIGYFLASLSSILIVVLAINSKDKPTRVPLPNKLLANYITFYLLMSALFFNVILSVILQIFYFIFVQLVYNKHLAFILFTLFELEVCLYFTTNPIYLFLCSCLLLIFNLNIYLLKFEERCLLKIGFTFGLTSLMILLFAVNTKIDIVEFHPENFWMVNSV